MSLVAFAVTVITAVTITVVCFGVQCKLGSNGQEPTGFGSDRLDLNSGSMSWPWALGDFVNLSKALHCCICIMK